MWFQLNMDSEGSEPKLCHKYARLRTRINRFYAFETTERLSIIHSNMGIFLSCLERYAFKYLYVG